MSSHQGKLEIARHHANHHVRLAVKKDSLVYDPLIPRKARTPHAITEHRYHLVLIIFLPGKPPSQERCHTQCWKSLRAHACCQDVCGVPLARQFQARICVTA
jgi:hypothetical protein